MRRKQQQQQLHGPCLHSMLSQPAIPACLSLQVFAIKDEVEDKQLQYPDYYTRAFHGAKLSCHAALNCCRLAVQQPSLLRAAR